MVNRPNPQTPMTAKIYGVLLRGGNIGGCNDALAQGHEFLMPLARLVLSERNLPAEQVSSPMCKVVCTEISNKDGCFLLVSVQARKGH